MTKAFGAVVKEWRMIRRMSQLDLALAATLSARHLSFLESGRAAPSRMMVLRLAEALDMPKAIANRALGAAGFAPAFPASAADAPDMVWGRRAIDMMLERHAPFPAVALDRCWNVVSANAGAVRLFAVTNAGASMNLVELLLSLGEGDQVANWEEVAGLALSRLRAEVSHLGGDPDLERFAARLAAHPRLASAAARPLADRVMIPMLINTSSGRLSLFSAIAQFGSAQEIAFSELKIELMFPADEATAAWFNLD